MPDWWTKPFGSSGWAAPIFPKLFYGYNLRKVGDAHPTRRDQARHRFGVMSPIVLYLSMGFRSRSVGQLDQSLPVGRNVVPMRQRDTEGESIGRPRRGRIRNGRGR